VAQEYTKYGQIPMLKCVDCKKPTRNYRCDECWTVKRAKGGYVQQIEFLSDYDHTERCGLAFGVNV